MLAGYIREKIASFAQLPNPTVNEAIKLISNAYKHESPRSEFMTAASNNGANMRFLMSIENQLSILDTSPMLQEMKQDEYLEWAKQRAITQSNTAMSIQKNHAKQYQEGGKRRSAFRQNTASKEEPDIDISTPKRGY